MSRAPSAVRAAQALIVWKVGVLIPDRRISFELTTDPDQYRVHYERRQRRRGRVSYSLVPTVTITPAGFREWETWHKEATHA
jgi:IS5 family transposase